ncbi:hypothetical protein EDC04DRAFT_58905 [Pisolithus marmoratus]|nr:hypothetical protein EDC04DRAFT_58905 [Pisolithus marmoratus]
MHPYLDKSSVHPNRPNSTVPCSTLPRTHRLGKSCTLDGAVEDTYLPPTRPKLVRNVVDPVCPGEEGSGLSPQGQPSASFQSDKAEGLGGGSYSVGDSVQPKLGLARVGDAYTGIPQTAVQEAGAPANATQYANCPTARCLYPGVEGTLCLQEISCATVPRHFAGHGVENKSRKEVIRCEWKGCVKKVSRHTFARHIREVHLRHTRGKVAKARRTIRGNTSNTRLIDLVK